MKATNPDLIYEMRDSLKRGVSEVFKTMLALEARSTSIIAEWHAPGEMLVASSVGFTGDVNGVVYMHVTAGFARTLACHMLGLAEAELDGDEMVNDVIGELNNMIVGCAKSRLCDAGSLCVLTIPSIVRGQSFQIEPGRGMCQHRLLAFRCGENRILIQLLMECST